MTTQLRDQPVSAVIGSTSNAEEVFEECGIDYWFGGDKTLADACAAAHLDVDALEKRLIVSETGVHPERERFQTLMDELLSHLDSSIRPAIAAMRSAAAAVSDPRAVSLVVMIEAIDAMTSMHAVLLRVRVMREISAGEDALQQTVVRDLALQHGLLAVRIRKVVALCAEIGSPPLSAAAQRLAKEIHHHIRISYEAVMPQLFELAKKKRGCEPG